MITLVSCDGKEFEIELGKAQDFETIRDAIRDSGTSAPFPLQGIRGEILAKIILYLNNHNENSKEWDNEFFNISNETLFEILTSTNYLNYQKLLDHCCEIVANMIRGKTPDQIRETFNIPKDDDEDENKDEDKEDDKEEN